MPLAVDEVVEIGDPATVDIYSAAFEQGCTLTVVFESADAALTMSRLLQVNTADFVTFDDPHLLDFGSEAIHASPSRAFVGENAYLYFVKATGLQSAVTAWRARFDGAAFEHPEELPPIAGVQSVLSWPYFFAASSDATVVAYRDGLSQPYIQTSGDGIVFSEPVRIANEAVAIATVDRFASGRFAYAFQIPGQTYRAYVSLSDDAASWSEPVLITEDSTNVHDAALVQRVDGDIDAYYIFPSGGHGFSIHRRAVFAGGSLGPQQVVTNAEHGNTQKPRLFRLSDGSLFLSYARVTDTQDGAPTALALSGARIVGDAPVR